MLLASVHILNVGGLMAFDYVSGKLQQKLVPMLTDPMPQLDLVDDGCPSISHPAAAFTPNTIYSNTTHPHPNPLCTHYKLTVQFLTSEVSKY